MYDINTIVSMNQKAGKQAKRSKLQPLIARYDRDKAVFQCPDLGNYEPKGWKKIQDYFVDSSGFGSPGEAALTAGQFLEKVKEGLGYAITESGQFQVYVTEFEKI